MKHFLFVSILFFVVRLGAQGIEVSRIDPPFWFTDMKTNKVELMVYGPNVALCEVTASKESPIKVLKVNKVDNPNYLFVEVHVTSAAKAGKYNLTFNKNGTLKDIPYEIKALDKEAKRAQGLDNSDFIYLLMPDRFANGDPTNDKLPAMRQALAHRDSLYGRHGGDIQGVINHLDYLKKLGITAIWMNPEIENDQPKESYHGYAATDLYKIDPRLGSNELYQQYVDKCHQSGMKVIKDVVFNHVGNQCWWYKDLPEKSWVHEFKEFTRTTYRSQTLFDPYASAADKTRMTDGWFDTHMPDLNQKNPRLARYLIQNSIWWVAFSGLDAYRIDTYPYPDLEFMNKWVEALQKEFPKLGFFGETWVDGVSLQAAFAQNIYASENKLPAWIDGKGKDAKSFASKLPAVTDFQLYFALTKAFNEKFGWSEGVMHLYNTLTQDYLYQNPYNNVVFLDNHDLGRYFSTVNEDLSKMKMASTFLLTTRGIPSIYYGTEILMKNNFDWNNHDKVREEFPGGWADHPQNKFEEAGRTQSENDYFNFLSKLANYRKNQPVLQSGKLMQFVPEDGIYTYFRYDEQHTVMVVINSNSEEKSLKTDRFAERMSGFGKGIDVLQDKLYLNLAELKVPARTALVVELLK